MKDKTSFDVQERRKGACRACLNGFGSFDDLIQLKRKKEKKESVRNFQDYTKFWNNLQKQNTSIFKITLNFGTIYKNEILTKSPATEFFV